MNLQQLALRVGKELHRHAPTILSGLAVAGVAATTYLAAKAGYKSAERIVEHEIMTGDAYHDRPFVCYTFRDMGVF